MPFSEEDTPSETTYIVKKGDTLYSISSRFKIPIENIIKLNNLTSNTLQIGQILKLKEETFPESKYYTVQKGDNLYSIARKYNTTVEALKKINNLDSNNLQIGKILLIENAAEPQIETPTTYTVQKGDNLYSIANKYNTTVDTLKKLNNLTSNFISEGQKLILS